ncbi:MAG: glycoside hydrolase family 95 protein [Kordiimonadaceae bacterium]|nr:glycoside hydrolase family 95 protein [Kordiimonadaceae bacterium]MBT6031676.1 glycoside hydrolase family 95 protein [Kordiimonadaceae bacterium]
MKILSLFTQLIITLFFGLITYGNAAESLSSQSSGHILWYKQAAGSWFEALPVGNGRMGAMVFGDPVNERIQLNEDSVWAGEMKDIKSSIGTPDDLADMRKLIDDQAFEKVDQQMPLRFSRDEVVRSHQTLGDLYINWNSTTASVSDYRRELDLRTGVANTTWKRGQTTFIQEVFNSNPDEALFIKITAQGPDTLNFDLELDRPQDQGHTTHKVKASTKGSVRSLYMSGQVTQRGGVLQGSPAPDMLGVHFAANLDAVSQEGTITLIQQKIAIKGAREVYIKLTAGTDFDGKEIDIIGNNSASLAADFKGLKQRHITDHANLYNRSRFDLQLSDSREDLPTDRRLNDLKENILDPGLERLIYHYGRYLLIASSRENGNPANLQGLWNERIAAPWNNDYHLNINLQMNYWPSDVTNLNETNKPLFKFMQRLAKNGAVTAREQYGMRGWMSHHATELFAQTVMKSRTAHWGSWIHGGGWMSQHLWTYYDYTRDKEFLAEIGYPLLSGQALFYLDWLVEKDGKLISYPETSPENRFVTKDGNPAAVVAGAAMGQQIITEVFTNTLSAAKALGINDEITKAIKVALPKLDNGLHIGPDGRLLEWDTPREEFEIGHRHMSHLYALHPGISITQKTPELLEAAKKSIAIRVENDAVGTGWSRAWAISMNARLRDGETAHFHLQEMLRTQTLDNGFNSIFGMRHHLFQIEANMGATAGIAEMLMQSHEGYIHLLPALPEAWPNGSIIGLRARGGHTIDISWKNGMLDKASIIQGPGILPDIYLQGKISATDPRISIK